MLPIQKLLIDYNSTARSENPKYIIIHDCGAISTARNNRDYFAGGNRNASADFFIDPTNIIQTIDYHVRYSWAVGDGNGKYGKTNGNTVNIEMCLENDWMPSGQTVQNTLDLTKYLMNELGISIDNVQRHYDCSFKACPNSFSANNWAKWYEFKTALGDNTIHPNPDPTPIPEPLHFSYPNNAKIINDDLYIRDANGNKLAGRYVSNGDDVTVLKVTSNLVKVEYPTQSGVKSGYVTNAVNCIQYTNLGSWHNGSTKEIVYAEDGITAIGNLDAYEKATLLYTKNGMTYVVYDTSKGTRTKSGYVKFVGL